MASLITMDKEWETQDHRKVRLFSTDLKNRDGFNVVGAVSREDGTEFAMQWKNDGTCWHDGLNCNEQLNLVRLLTKHEAWTILEKQHVVFYSDKSTAQETIAREDPFHPCFLAHVTWED